jgi:meiotic recombination protein SPO11
MESLLDSPDFSSSTLSSSSPLLEVNLVNPSLRNVASHHNPQQRNHQTGVIIAKIEEILAAMIDALKETRILTIPLRSRSTGRERLVRFPGSGKAEVKKFSMS